MHCLTRDGRQVLSGNLLSRDQSVCRCVFNETKVGTTRVYLYTQCVSKAISTGVLSSFNVTFGHNKQLKSFHFCIYAHASVQSSSYYTCNGVAGVSAVASSVFVEGSGVAGGA